MSKKIRVCLLGASLSTGNMGVSALASGTVSAVLRNFPDAEVFLLDYGKELDKHTIVLRNGPVTVELVNIRFSKKLYLRNNIARLLLTAVLGRLLPERARCSLLAKNPSLKSVLDADVVVSIAGGDSFSDIYGLGRLVYVALPQILALQLKKPLILLPQTLGPFKGTVAKAIARYIMRRAQIVCSRDQNSFSEAKSLLGAYQDKLKFSHDMAFVLEAVKPDEKKMAQLPARDGRRLLVGFNVSGLLLMGGYTRDNMFGLKGDYPKLVREIVQSFVEEHQADVLLVPHVFGLDAESDVLACERVFEELRADFPGKLHLLKGDFNQHEIKYVIGQCDFFLGSRMHACIAAMSQSVPAVCLAYSRKFVGVMETIGRADYVVDLCATNNGETMAMIQQLFTCRLAARDELNVRIPEVRKGVFALFARDFVRLGRG